MLKYNGWVMDKYISKVLDNRLQQPIEGKRKQYAIDLALETDLANETNITANTKASNKTVRKHVIAQAKTFLFAGHDTVSGTLCYAYYLLSKDLGRLAAARKEHNDVLGTDVSKAAALIKAKPQILNKLEYTLAIIRETLRLYPPASTVRSGEKE